MPGVGARWRRGHGTARFGNMVSGAGAFLQTSRVFWYSRGIGIGRPPTAVCTVAQRCPVAHDTSPSSMALLRSAFVHLLTQSLFLRIIDAEFDCISAVLSTGVYLKKYRK
jgi:hypothetical protein